MTLTLRPYADYRAAPNQWLHRLPAHWEAKPLKQIGHVQLSGVDKLSAEGEQPVRLCNYVDVYKHDTIRRSHPFMEATATPAEIQRFQLRRGDVLLTKDSEAWDDIGIPAVIADDLPGVLCGYHLAMIRPNVDQMEGSFLFWALVARPSALQFHVAATGVTRFGISKSDIKNVIVPVPPAEEQQAIGRFLWHIQLTTNGLIRNRHRLIALLTEQKQAIIQQAVTRGLDPDAPMNPSGVDWLGAVPVHWDMRRLKSLTEFVTSGSRD